MEGNGEAVATPTVATSPATGEAVTVENTEFTAAPVSPLPSATMVREATSTPESTTIHILTTPTPLLPVPTIEQGTTTVLKTPTPIMPQLIFTPTPKTFIEILSDKPLVFDDTTVAGYEMKTQINAFAYSSVVSNPVILLGWTNNNEIVVRPGFDGNTPPGQLPTPTPGPDAQWAISPITGQVRLAPDWSDNAYWTDGQKQLLQNLNTILPEYPRTLSPDGQYLTIGHFGDKLYVYDVNHNIEEYLILPQEKTNVPNILAWVPPTWSVDGSKLAYVVATDKDAFEIPDITNIYPDAHPYLRIYQIHIYDFSKGSLTKLNLPHVSYSPAALTWSPDGRYLAFVSPPAPQEHIHLFIMDFNNQIWNDITPDWEKTRPDYLWPNTVYWSPNGEMLAYGDTKTGIIYLMTMSY